MMLSIRLRISLTVFAVVMSLLAIQMVFVLERVDRALLSHVDSRLDEEIAEIEPWLGTEDLQAMIDEAESHRQRFDEIFFEIRDAEGRLVAASTNVPEGGLLGARGDVQEDSVEIREEVHPASRRGHRWIRVAETRVGPYHVQVAQSLERKERRYKALRTQLLSALALIAMLGAGAAYLVATRALRPVQRIAARARKLQTLAEGELPRTGSGDEIDELAVVLNDLLRRIRAEVSRMRRMAADAGHALRTPLTAIRGNLELLIGRASKRNREQLGGVLEEVDRLIRLVNQLLLLEKLEASDGGPADFRRFDAGLLAEETVEHLRVIAEDQGIKLECSREPAPVRGDASQIRQALLNLLDNALRHTPRGGRTIVEVRTTDGRVRISISDTGPGLPAEDLERVFERFYAAPGGTGTGLGLPIARAIARAHGGDLHATSPGGAAFILELPLTAQD